LTPFRPPGKLGEKDCAPIHEALLRAEVQTGLNAQRIFPDWKAEVGFGGSNDCRGPSTQMTMRAGHAALDKFHASGKSERP
jgi:hypothetical protein